MNNRAQWHCAQFYCTQCNALAATLTLDAEQQLVQRDFWGVTTEKIQSATYPALALAVAAADAAALYKIDFLWVPFYCPTCQQVYCYTHWTLETTADDDFPGWYDCTYGTCPQGHRRLIDD
ncbi:MAG: hypothetical protein KF832_31205 [Caldilineaceae bacterium]|nr:hypothetical protein [Caldilineaceae bacterium]